MGEVKYILKSKAIILDYRYRGLIKVEALFKSIWIQGLIHSEELVKLLETFLLINVRNNEKGTSIHYKFEQENTKHFWYINFIELNQID